MTLEEAKPGDRVRIVRYDNEPEIVGMECNVIGHRHIFIETDFCGRFCKNYVFRPDELELVK